jgi:hypothetical protein
MSFFGVDTPKAFFTQVVVPRYEAFLDDNASPANALIAILVAYHMYEWVHQGKAFELASSTLPSAQKEAFELARRLANSTKHFKLKQTRPVSTRRQSGFSSDFSDEFARPLMIERDDGSEISADELLGTIIDHWRRVIT